MRYHVIKRNLLLTRVIKAMREPGSSRSNIDEIAKVHKSVKELRYLQDIAIIYR